MKLELTEQEGNTLLEILNVAVKAQGLNLCEPILYFYKKLHAAHAEEKEKVSSPPIALVQPDK